MKKRMFSTLSVFSLVLFAGMLFQSCEKDETTPTDSDISLYNSTVKSKESTPINKAADSNVSSMAQAANVSAIDYDNGTYYVSFYDGTPDHSVTINAFDMESQIELEVNAAGAISTTLFDVPSETISIENVGTYSFTDFEDESISGSGDPIQNVSILIAAHHFSAPTSSASFADNGNADVFPAPASGAARVRFWKNTVQHGPCTFGRRLTWVHWERFWLFEGNTEPTVEPC